ncbi:putative immunity protein [Sphingobacterium lactis]|uniref:putative immunity protein n=1 Tax=Sphingobacterium lactis TaxID=797291 RepID=UPI003EC75346
MNIYAYQRPIGEIQDIPALRKKYISIFETKDKNQIARFGLLYGQHILDITNTKPNTEITLAFEAIQEWIDGKVNYHKARNISFRHLYNMDACEAKEIIEKKIYKIMGQIASIPHVKAHGLWATDFAITLINRMYPNNMDEVQRERLKQIELIMNV